MQLPPPGAGGGPGSLRGSSGRQQLNVNAEVPTPFVVPWTWYSKQRLFWPVPKTLGVTVDVDGVDDGTKHSAVMHSDPQASDCGLVR